MFFKWVWAKAAVVSWWEVKTGDNNNVLDIVPEWIFTNNVFAKNDKVVSLLFNEQFLL